jgi:dolichol-phosphate mannosyltransferase
MKIAVVIAAYDERENVEELARGIDRTLRTLPETSHETIFVVEGKDGTCEILRNLESELGAIRILYREEPNGLGNAFRRGFASISDDAELVVTLDADLNHDPREIPRLIEELKRQNADLLIGSRFVPGGHAEGIPLWKRLLSVVMNRVIGTLFGVEARDKTSGFRVYRAAALRRLTGYRNENFACLPEILILAHGFGMRVCEAPIRFTYRRRGKSKMSLFQTSLSYLALLQTRLGGWRDSAEPQDDEARRG